jgi:hypothetical protein
MPPLSSTVRFSSSANHYLHYHSPVLHAFISIPTLSSACRHAHYLFASSACLHPHFLSSVLPAAILIINPPVLHISILNSCSQFCIPPSSLPVLYSVCCLPHLLIVISACRHSLVGCTVLHASICSSFYPFCLPLSSLPVICSACWYSHSYIVLHASIPTRCDSSASHYPHFLL